MTLPVTSIVERAARAAQAAQDENLGGGIIGPWEDTPESTKAEWRSVIRALLRAIREPSEKMHEAAEIEFALGLPTSPWDKSDAIWQAMIDAAEVLISDQSYRLLREHVSPSFVRRINDALDAWAAANWMAWRDRRP